MAITLAGGELTALGWWLVRSSGLDDLPAQSLQVGSLPAREHGVVLSRLRTEEPQDGTLTVACRATTAQALTAAIAALDAVIGSGTPIVLTHTRRYQQRKTVHVIGGPSSYGPGPEGRGPFYLEIGLRVRAIDPCWEDANEQSVNFTTSAVAVPQWTRTTRGVITIAASGSTVTDPEIVLKDGAGNPVVTLQPDIAIESGDAWQIDCVTEQVRKRVSGVWSNAIDTLPSGFTFPVFRREYWTPGTTNPTLQTSGGAGTVTYRRRTW